MANAYVAVLAFRNLFISDSFLSIAIISSAGFISDTTVSSYRTD